MHNNRLTEAEESEIRAAHGRTGSIRAAAREVGRSFNAVSRVLGGQANPPQAIDYDLLAAKLAPLLSRGPVNEGPPPQSPGGLATQPRSGVTIAPKIHERIAWLSDIHVPYHDPAAVNAALDFCREWRPTLLILGGDLFDCYSVSRYEKSPDQLNDRLQDEFDAAKPIVRDVSSLNCEVIFMLGNHEARIDAMVAANPGLAGLRCLGWPKMAELPAGWSILPSQSRYRVGNLDFLHGDLKGRGTGARHIAAWMLAKLKRSAIFGHYHKSNIFFDPDGDGILRAGFATGHLCDTDKAATYCPVNDWNAGFASVDMDPATGLYEVRSHTIHGGKFRHAGKTYGG